MNEVRELVVVVADAEDRILIINSGDNGDCDDLPRRSFVGDTPQRWTPRVLGETTGIWLEQIEGAAVLPYNDPFRLTLDRPWMSCIQTLVRLPGKGEEVLERFPGPHGLERRFVEVEQFLRHTSWGHHSHAMTGFALLRVLRELGYELKLEKKELGRWTGQNKE